MTRLTPKVITVSARMTGAVSRHLRTLRSMAMRAKALRKLTSIGPCPSKSRHKVQVIVGNMALGSVEILVYVENKFKLHSFTVCHTNWFAKIVPGIEKSYGSIYD